jgi:hypothetical protein
LRLDGFHGAGGGALAALIAEVDAVVAGHRETGLDAQHAFARVDLPEILEGAGQAAGAAARALFMDRLQ